MNALRLLALGVAAMVSAAIGFGSRAPYRPPGSETSVLRLSWRLRGEKQEECRARTPEEFANLPVHMRSPEVCTGHLVSYRMTLRMDEAPPVVRVFAPAGAKGDRPIFVMHDQPVTPGEHEIVVELAPIEEAREDEGEDEHDGTVQFRFHSRVRMMPGQIVLVTLSDDAMTLLLKR